MTGLILKLLTLRHYSSLSPRQKLPALDAELPRVNPALPIPV